MIADRLKYPNNDVKRSFNLTINLQVYNTTDNLIAKYSKFSPVMGSGSGIMIQMNWSIQMILRRKGLRINYKRFEER